MKKIFYGLIVVSLALFFTGCDEWDELVDSSGGSDDSISESLTETSSSTDDSSDDSDDATSSDKFHHYNPRAFDGKGVAIVFCPDEARFDSCELNDDSMELHGNQDEDRDVWKILGDTGISGTVVCEKDGDSYSFDVSGSKMHYGSCD